MARTLSIEVGSSITRICELDYRVKTPRLYKYCSIPTPQGVWEDGFIRDNGELCLAVKRALSENQIKTKQVVFSVTSSKVVTREITIPAIKESMVGAFVKSNANDYFPIDLSAYEISHMVLGAEKSEDGKESLKVMAIAAGKDLIAGYAQFAAACGLRFQTLDYCGNSIYQIMKGECGAETVMVVKVEDSSTIVSVISGQNLMIQRNLANGFDRALHTMAELSGYYEADYGEMLKTMCQRPCIRVVLNDRTRVVERDEVYNESEEALENRRKITDTFTQLTGNLQRVMELYNSKAKEHPVEKLVLIGLGSEIVGLNKLFANELGLPVTVLQDLKDVAGFQVFEGAPGIGRYVGGIGASVAPVELVNEQTNKKGALNVNYGIMAALTGIFCAVLAGGLALLALMPYGEEKSKEKRLKQEEATYAKAEGVYNQYQAVLKLHTYVRSRCQMTEHANDGLVAFLEELEQKLPSDVIVDDYLSEGEAVTLTMRVTSLEEAAKVFQILRGFDSVMEVEVGTTAEDDTADDGTAGEGEEGEETVKRMKFSAVCYYYPIAVEDPEALPAAE